MVAIVWAAIPVVIASSMAVDTVTQIMKDFTFDPEMTLPGNVNFNPMTMVASSTMPSRGRPPHF